MLQSFVQQGAFFNLLHTRYIVVAAADDTYHVFAFYLVPVKIQRADTQRPGRFGNDSVRIIQAQYRRTHLSFGNNHYIIAHSAANLERSIPDALYGSAVYELVYLVE